MQKKTLALFLALLSLLIFGGAAAPAEDRPWNPDGTISVLEEPKANQPPGDTVSPARWNLVGTLSVSEEYDDNLFFSDDDQSDKTEDFVTTVSPGLELSRTTDRLLLRLIGRLDRRMYLDETDLNATDQSYLASIRYAASPRLSLSGQAGYTKDSSPDRDFETTGLVLGTTKREQWRYGLSADYRISEGTSAALSYAYAKDNEKSDDDDDSESHTATLLLSGDLGYLIRESKWRLTLGYSQNDYSDTKDNSYKLMAGFSKSLSETWSFVVDAGARHTRTRYEETAYEDERDENDWGFVGNTELSWQGEKTGVSFSLSQDFLPASGRETSTNRTSLGASVSHQFSAELSGFVSGGYHRNRSDNSNDAEDETDEDTFYGRIGARYAFMRDLGIEASYSYSKTEYNNDNTDADRNLFMVRIYARHSFLD